MTEYQVPANVGTVPVSLMSFSPLIIRLVMMLTGDSITSDTAIVAPNVTTQDEM